MTIGTADHRPIVAIEGDYEAPGSFPDDTEEGIQNALNFLAVLRRGAPRVSDLEFSGLFPGAPPRRFLRR